MIAKIIAVLFGVFVVTSAVCPVTPTGLLCAELSAAHTVLAAFNTALIAPQGCGVFAESTHCCSQWCAGSTGGKCDYNSLTSDALRLLNNDNTSPNTATGVCTCPGDLYAGGCIYANGRNSSYPQGYAPTLSACQAYCNALPSANTCRSPAYVFAGVAVCICYCAP